MTRNTFERSDASPRKFTFTIAEKKRIETFCPESDEISKATFINRIELAVTMQSLPMVTEETRARRRRMEQIASTAAALHGLLNAASPYSLVDVLDGTQAAIEPLGLSIVDKEGKYLLSAVIAAIEASALESLQRPLATIEDDLIRNAAFAYQMAFGLRPTSTKNSAFRKALEGVNTALGGRPKVKVKFPIGEIAIRKMLTGFGCPTLPIAKRGRKRKNAPGTGQN